MKIELKTFQIMEFFTIKLKITFASFRLLYFPS